MANETLGERLVRRLKAFDADLHDIGFVRCPGCDHYHMEKVCPNCKRPRPNPPAKTPDS